MIPGNKKKPLHRRVGMCAKRLEVSRHIIRICAVPLFDIAGQENILKGLPKLIDVRQQVRRIMEVSVALLLPKCKSDKCSRLIIA